MNSNVSQHRPEILAVLDAHGDTSQARRAASALARLLANTYAAGELPATWSQSRLTGGGFPVEFTYTTADSSLRYTVDTAVPGSPPAGQLSSLAEWLEQIGSPPIEPSLMLALAGCQRDAELDYGAWLGGRHNLHGDRYKLYAEVPPGRTACLENILRAAMANLPRLPDRPIQVRMLGYDPAAARLELYYRAERLETDHLPHLLKAASMLERYAELLAWIESAYGRSLGGKLPGGSVGFSYSLGYPSEKAQVPQAFTLFLFARSLWGGDARIRLRFAEQAQALGGDAHSYLIATAPLASRDVYQTYHGLLGISLSPGAPLRLSIGVRPPLPEAVTA